VTLALKARAHRDKMGILRRENVLYRSLVNRSDSAGVKEVTARTARFGTSVPYARRHQDGWLVTQVFGRPVEAQHNVLPRKIVPKELPATTAKKITLAAMDYLRDGTVT
jgi:hypothetical protein